MLIIHGIKLDSNLKVRNALTHLFGLGRLTAEKICNILGFPKTLYIKDLTHLQKEKLIKIIQQNYIIETKLKNIIISNIDRYKNNGSIRGYRLKNKLPVRGQRTHSNAKTQKKMKL